ncbi:sensor histidine kinase [Marilutibacter chinensis]|uniref:histidine kinase n=1 Tax=Marilutibacter chinensis TaxID=2912247 RepID=A0ABS9HU65_9GAMM|nr:ATP-binding protein [Lysobacter chinensis]MCF7221632.1 ATP-binding protein [Lysobacter chinensis]
MDLRRRFAGWMKHVSVDAPQNRRNALMLQTILAIVGTAALAMAIGSFATAETAGRNETWVAMAISTYAWLCFHLSRKGLYRLSASLTVIGSLQLIGTSYYIYGLQAQPGLLMIHLMPLLFAGLLLGRAAVWWTTLANAIVLAIGAWSDMQHAANTAATSEILPNLLLSGMNFLVLAVILDRLIRSSQRAIERSRELDAACRDLKREIEEKERAYARLLQTQRMEAIGRLSAGAAHDFNNILNVIVGLATASHPRDTSAVLPQIHRAAQRGTVVTRRLLSFSRMQSRQTSVFDLAEAIDEMRTLILPMLHRGIRASLDMPPPGLLIETDRDELELALLNIVGNACDAMPRGGRFSMSAHAVDDKVLIRMEDTGEGMSPEVLANLFEPFFTTKPKGEGTGIGMTIVHRFVTESRGELKVQSSPGQGTRVDLLLPRVQTVSSRRRRDDAVAVGAGDTR